MKVIISESQYRRLIVESTKDKISTTEKNYQSFYRYSNRRSTER